MKNITLLIAFILTWSVFTVQAQRPDTVEVQLASSSKIIMTMQDRNDLEQLKQYDYQALFDDVITRLEKKDSASMIAQPSVPSTSPIQPATDPGYTDNHPYEMKKDRDEDHDRDRNRYPKSRQYVNFDFGFNNFLEDGLFPDANNALYSVRPWGSWYVGINAIHHIRFTQHFSLEGGVGVTWYNFKFDEDNTLLTKNEDGVVFTADPRNLNFTKSKLTVAYVNASLIPVLNFPGHQRHNRWQEWRESEFRIGAGPYVGYRISSYAKLQYEEDGETEVERDRDNFYLENIRYGVRLQIGIHGTDFFVNYDLNNLFTENKGPKLNAYSFGVIF